MHNFHSLKLKMLNFITFTLPTANVRLFMSSHVFALTWEMEMHSIFYNFLFFVCLSFFLTLSHLARDNTVYNSVIIFLHEHILYCMYKTPASSCAG